jgi:hypothetical protein
MFNPIGHRNVEILEICRSGKEYYVIAVAPLVGGMRGGTFFSNVTNKGDQNTSAYIRD